jgi:hypothetical protein
MGKKKEAVSCVSIKSSGRYSIILDLVPAKVDTWLSFIKELFILLWAPVP